MGPIAFGEHALVRLQTGTKIVPEPPTRSYAIVWFQCGGQQLHLGVENDFRPAKKAHP